MRKVITVYALPIELSCGDNFLDATGRGKVRVARLVFYCLIVILMCTGNDSSRVYRFTLPRCGSAHCARVGLTAWIWCFSSN